MNTNKDGGPAFPVTHSIDGNWQKEPDIEFRGMTLRDWFAGQALKGYLSRGDPIGGYANAATISYKCADAMLEARPK